MEKDFIIENFTPPPHPKNIQLNGRTVRLEPLDALKHAEDLFQSNSFDREGMNWKYLPYGPFEKIEDYANWLQEKAKSDDPSFFAIIRHINYSPLLQKTREGTEAMYLMMKWVFESGYRRYEWKCNALNAKSRYAAQRLGFSYEGVFRQMAINKGKNRNTAWFAAIDKEWNALKESYEIYLSDDNFDIEQKPKRSLSDLTKPILYKLDNKEFG
jgi:hypothetical protein